MSYKEELEAMERFYDALNAEIDDPKKHHELLNWAVRLLGHYYGLVKEQVKKEETK